MGRYIHDDSDSDRDYDDDDGNDRFSLALQPHKDGQVDDDSFQFCAQHHHILLGRWEGVSCLMDLCSAILKSLPILSAQYSYNSSCLHIYHINSVYIHVSIFTAPLILPSPQVPKGRPFIKKHNF